MRPLPSAIVKYMRHSLQRVGSPVLLRILCPDQKPDGVTRSSLLLIVAVAAVVPSVESNCPLPALEAVEEVLVSRGGRDGTKAAVGVGAGPN